MATRVILPKQGLQMVEGTITRWIVQEGQTIEEGMPLFEMETDKLTIEISSPVSGTLLKIVKPAGETVPITELIAVIGDAGEDIKDLISEGNKNEAEDQPASRIFSTPRARMIAEEKKLDLVDITATGPDVLVIEKDVIEYAENAVKAPKILKATPMAKKIAQINELELSQVEGTGARGKITKADVWDAVAARTGKPAVDRKDVVIPFVGIRKVIADNMMKSLHGMAQANHKMKVDMSEVVRFKEKLKADGVNASYTDILIKVVSNALLDYPIVNSSLTEKGILLKGYVNMGVAVALENGLIVPVIKDVDQLTLKEISNVSKELTEKAKTGKLAPDEYKEGTFTITNLGMFDLDEFTAVINPPESAILAIGKIDRVPIAEGESIVIRPIMVLSLTYDHRIIDGAPAAKFLQRIKQLLQNPYLLI